MLDTIQRAIHFLFKLTYSPLNRLTGGVYGIVVTAVKEFFRQRALEAGASIAYYALFSLFPLVIFLILILSFFIHSERVQVEVLVFIESLFPVPNEAISSLVGQSLQVLIDRRNSFSLLAVIGLLWAGSNVFMAIARNINRAWHITAAPLNFWKGRLVAFGMISGLAGLLLLSFISNAILNLLSRLQLPFSGGVAIYQTPAWMLFAGLLPYLLSFIIFVITYRWVPNTDVRWSEAISGAVVATIAWRLTIGGLTWVIKFGFLNYEVLYGSVATILIAMFWLHIGSLILLFGAHLSAAIARHRRLELIAAEEAVDLADPAPE